MDYQFLPWRVWGEPTGPYHDTIEWVEGSLHGAVGLKQVHGPAVTASIAVAAASTTSVALPAAFDSQKQRWPSHLVTVRNQCLG